MSEKVGNFKEVFEEVIRNFIETKDKNGNNLSMDSIIVTSSEGETLEHYFNGNKTINDLRSASKPIIGLALGTALEKGLYFDGQKITLDTLVWPFFEDLVNLTNSDNIPKLKKVKLKHFLTHTIGHDVGLMFSKDIKDIPPEKYLDLIWNTDMTYDPGKFFVYANAGPFLISVLIQEGLGINLSQWVKDIIFEPLDIRDFQWKNYGKYCAASTGLRLSHEDFHKFALVFQNDGRYNDEQIVPKVWIDEMRTTKVLTPTMYDIKRVFPKYSYGYYLFQLSY